MNKLLMAMGLLMLAGGAMAAGKPCEELKAEIAAKLDAKGVRDLQRLWERVHPRRLLCSPNRICTQSALSACASSSYDRMRSACS
ncbi:MAG: hypothetical protein EOP15_14610 [Pseudomonas sp.]|nr:MAG: hypothetical protein EOP15_14610 [Pseudomonas sp.]